MASAAAICAMVALVLSDADLDGNNFAARPAGIIIGAVRRVKRSTPGAG